MYRTCSETTSPKMLLTFAGARQLRCAPIMTIVWVLVLICCGVVFEPYIVSAEMYEGDSCSTPKSGSGICTTLKKCKAMNNAISRGELTSNEVVTCGLAVYEELICCPKDNRMDTLNETPTSTPIITRLPRPAVLACSAIDAELGAALSPHIIGGTVADVGEFPHMAAIGYTSISEGPGQYEFRCGGTLIEKRFVLTAAHCVNSRQSQPAIVRLGAVNFEDPAEMRNVVELKIKFVTIHPDYDDNLKVHDIAIIELEVDVPYTSTIYPTCLYSELLDPPPKYPVYVTGWGHATLQSHNFSHVLQKAELEVEPIHRCSASFPTLQLNVNHMCAVDRNHTKDACQGDSGGPLIVVIDHQNHKYRIIGIISTGFLCGSEEPSLYTRVSAHLDFIEKVVWPVRLTLGL